MTTPVPTRDGATVMLVRDGGHAERRLEVLMLRRHPSTAFGSVHVFPGGVVDDDDHRPELQELSARSDDDASIVLGIPTGGLAFWLAAIRESFEEAGVLLARGNDGELVRCEDDPARFAAHRGALHDGTRTFLDVLTAEGLRPATDLVHYVSHWVTPESEPMRYDTRFFVARVPDGQECTHDDRELIDSHWIRPEQALEQHAAGGYALIFPTIASLEEIGRFDTADQLVAAYDLTRAGADGGAR